MKTNIKSYIKYIALAFFAGATTGCVDEEWNLDKMDESVKVKYELALPLIKSTFSVEDALNEYNDDVELKANEDGLLYFEYKTNIDFNDLPEFEVATIDYFSFKQSDQDIPDPITLAGSSFDVSRTNEAVLSAGTGGLDTVYLSAGSLGIKMQTGFVSTANIDEAFTITIDNMTKDGQVLTATFDPTLTDTATIDIAGYTIKLKQNSGEESIPIKVTYHLESQTQNQTTLEQEAWLKVGFSSGLKLDMVAAYLEEPVLVEQTFRFGAEHFS